MATRNGAAAMGRDDIGTLAAGNIADLIVLARNPFEDIENLRSITHVMRAGHLYRIDEDPVEINDLTQAEPELFAKMVAAYDRYAEAFNLIEVPDDYNPITQLQKNAARNQGEEMTDEVPPLD